MDNLNIQDMREIKKLKISSIENKTVEKLKFFQKYWKGIKTVMHH